MTRERHTKIAILYGHEPSGHVTAARAVGEQLALRGAEVSYIDLSRDFYRHSGEMVSGFYLEVLSRAPIFWRIVYDNPLLVALSRPGRKLYLKLSGDSRRMSAMLDAGGFDAAVCTHSLPCFVLSLSCKKPLFGVVTDFSAHHFWPEENVAAYFVHEETARADMISRQIPPEKVVASGIPVAAAYAKPIPQDAALRGFRLDPNIPCAMLCGGSKGMGDMEKCFNTLAGIDGLQLIAACGSNRRLFMQLTRLAAGMPRVRVLADAADLSHAMSAASFIVGKPGGVTCAETLALQKPLLIFAPLAGQEWRNTKFLTARNAALLAKNTRELSAAARRLMEDAALREKLSAAMSPLSKPAAAEKIASAVLRACC